MAEEEMALGLQGTKRIENIQMGLARGHVFMSRETTYSLRIHDQTVAYLSPSQKNIQPCSSIEFQGYAFFKVNPCTLLTVATFRKVGAWERDWGPASFCSSNVSLID